MKHIWKSKGLAALARHALVAGLGAPCLSLGGKSASQSGIQEPKWLPNIDCSQTLFHDIPMASMPLI